MRRKWAFDQAEAAHELARFTEIYDEPFGDPSGIPTAILSRLAVSRVKVALSADGGDEQFCGYTGYVRYPALWERVRGLPLGLRRLLASGLGGAARCAGPLLSLAWPGRNPHVVARLCKLAGLVGATGPGAVAALYAQKGFAPAEVRALLGLDATPPPPGPDMPSDVTAAELTDRLMRHDFATWLPEDILLKVDRASMHASLESRDPLLDHRLAELAYSLPLSSLSGGGEQKRIDHSPH